MCAYENARWVCFMVLLVDYLFSLTSWQVYVMSIPYSIIYPLRSFPITMTWHSQKDWFPTSSKIHEYSSSSPLFPFINLFISKSRPSLVMHFISDWSLQHTHTHKNKKKNSGSSPKSPLSLNVYQICWAKKWGYHTNSYNDMLITIHTYL